MGDPDDESDDSARGVSTRQSITNVEGATERFLHWFLLTGGRFHVAGLIVAATAVLVAGGIASGYIAIGPDGTASTVFSSGLISGTLTVVTIALSINQLILSRMFGSPDELRDKLTGTQELRSAVHELADEPASPNDPSEFLSLVGRTLEARTERLRSAFEDADVETTEEIDDYLDGIGRYGDNIASQVERSDPIVDVLNVVLGTEYAQNMTATEGFRNEYEARLTPEMEDLVDDVSTLLEAVAISRQFFKTLSLQQDFARLSRVIAYSGFIAVLSAVAMALIYRTNSVTVPESVLPAVVTIGIVLIVTPLALFIAYVLRAATIGRKTVSVGPFVPPESRD